MFHLGGFIDNQHLIGLTVAILDCEIEVFIIHLFEARDLQVTTVGVWLFMLDWCWLVLTDWLPVRILLFVFVRGRVEDPIALDYPTFDFFSASG